MMFLLDKSSTWYFYKWKHRGESMTQVINECLWNAQQSLKREMNEALFTEPVDIKRLTKERR